MELMLLSEIIPKTIYEFVSFDTISKRPLNLYGNVATLFDFFQSAVMLHYVTKVTQGVLLQD